MQIRKILKRQMDHWSLNGQHPWIPFQYPRIVKTFIFTNLRQMQNPINSAIACEKMGTLCKLVDAVLFAFFLIIAIAAPLLDAQTCLPKHFFPPFLVELKSWYSQEYGDYLISEKPNFFVGLVWLELIFQWPLAVACIYGIVAGKSWFSTTCLIYGASTLTTMVKVLFFFFIGLFAYMLRICYWWFC